jgi:hypothetical protein
VVEKEEEGVRNRYEHHKPMGRLGNFVKGQSRGVIVKSICSI